MQASISADRPHGERTITVTPPPRVTECGPSRAPDIHSLARQGCRIGAQAKCTPIAARVLATVAQFARALMSAAIRDGRARISECGVLQW